MNIEVVAIYSCYLISTLKFELFEESHKACLVLTLITFYQFSHIAYSKCRKLCSYQDNL
jgi:hypothetical protein